MSWMRQSINFKVPSIRPGWQGRWDALVFAFTGRCPYIEDAPHTFSIFAKDDVTLEVSTPQVVRDSIDGEVRK